MTAVHPRCALVGKRSPVRTSSASTPRKSPARVKPKRRFPPEVLTDTKVRALINGCPATSATGLRNKALLALLDRSGLRISEALDLYPKDVDLERGAIRVLHGKGDKARVVGVDRDALAVLARWLDVRACCGHGAARAIFCTSSGQRLTTGYVRRWLPALALGDDANVYTFLAELGREGVPQAVGVNALSEAGPSDTLRSPPQRQYLDHIVAVGGGGSDRGAPVVIVSCSARFPRTAVRPFQVSRAGSSLPTTETTRPRRQRTRDRAYSSAPSNAIPSLPMRITTSRFAASVPDDMTRRSRAGGNTRASTPQANGVGLPAVASRDNRGDTSSVECATRMALPRDQSGHLGMSHVSIVAHIEQRGGLSGWWRLEVPNFNCDLGHSKGVGVRWLDGDRHHAVCQLFACAVEFIR